MTQQFTNLQTSINDQWTSAQNQMARNHEASTVHLTQVRTEMTQNFSYLYSHLHIPPFDPINPAQPIPCFTPLQQMYPQQGTRQNLNQQDMDQS